MPVNASRSRSLRRPAELRKRRRRVSAPSLAKAAARRSRSSRSSGRIWMLRSVSADAAAEPASAVFVPVWVMSWSFAERGVADHEAIPGTEAGYPYVARVRRPRGSGLGLVVELERREQPLVARVGVGALPGERGGPCSLPG